MKAKILDKTGKETGVLELPSGFDSGVREDILLKVFEAQKRHQPFGVMFMAGRWYSAAGILRRKRHAWKVTYGKGISRVPRKIMSRSGTQFNWIGATSPNTRGGGRAHPPKAEENQERKINRKELEIAFNSALVGTSKKEFLEKKYDIKVATSLPVVFDPSVLGMKSKEFFQLLETVYGSSFDKILQHKHIRAGKGKARGRKYKKNSGLLFVLGNEENMKRKGIDVVHAGELQVKDLAPNGVPGRFVCYTEKAIKEIKDKFNFEKNEKSGDKK